MKEKKYKKVFKRGISITGKILIALFDFCEDISFIHSHPYLSMAMGTEMARDYLAESRRTIRYAYRRLKRRGYIKEKKQGEKIIWQLTNDGKIAALKIAMQFQNKTRKDGKFYIVSYDIPVAARATRSFFRHTLKLIGLKYLQHSVWYTNKEIVSDLTQLLSLLRIKKWVKLLIAETVPFK